VQNFTNENTNRLSNHHKLIFARAEAQPVKGREATCEALDRLAARAIV